MGVDNGDECKCGCQTITSEQSMLKMVRTMYVSLLGMIVFSLRCKIGPGVRIRANTTVTVNGVNFGVYDIIGSDDELIATVSPTLHGVTICDHKHGEVFNDIISLIEREF